MPLPRRFAVRVWLAGALLLLGVGGAAAQQKVGISGAVNPEVNATPPGAQQRRLTIGQDVVFNERITSTAEGQTQIVFLDESTMTVGPNSDLVIDQFVYDPKSGTGRLAMSATRGLMRYVGGKLSKQDGAVTLRSSTATLAVRGGAFIANLNPNGSAEIIFLYGAGLTVAGLPAVQLGATQIITRPGFEITIGADGRISSPHPVPPGRLAQLIQALDGRPGGTGGLAAIPTETTVLNSGIGQIISGNIANSIIQSVQNGAAAGAAGGATSGQPFGGGAGLISLLTNVSSQATGAPSQVIDCVTTGTCNPANTVTVAATASGQPIGGSSSGPTPPPTGITVSGRLKNTNGHGTTFGFVDQSVNGDIPYAGGQLVNGVFTGSFGNLGTISFPLSAGLTTFGPQGTSSGFGTFSGTSFLSADNTFFYANVTPTSQPTARLFVFGGTPVNPAFYQPTGSTRIFAFTVQPDAALQSNMPFVRSQAGGNLGGATVSPLFVVAPPTTAIGDASTAVAARALQASLAVTGQGANQQSAIAVTAGTIGSLQSSGQPIFNGQLRGSSLLSAGGTPVALRSAASSTVDGAGNSFYGANAISGFVVDQTAYASGGNGTVGSAIMPSTAAEVPLSGGATNYGFAQPAVPSPVPSGVGASRTTQALSGNFGGLVYTTAQTNPYIVTGGTLISTEAATNRVQATLAGSPQSPSSGVSALTLQFGGLSGNGGAQAFIDDRTFAAAESTTNPQQLTINNTTIQPKGQLYLVSSGAAGQPTAILPNGVSYCQCQFLQWGYWGGDLDSSSTSFPRIDAGHINTWVAGVPTPLGDISALAGQSATATYTGHAIGSVFNNGQSYLAAGGFNGTYNFGTQSGTLAITNFDGHNFAATGRAPLTGANYSFGVTTPGARGVVNGTFYGPMAAETGGNFAVQTTVGPTYLASGIFAGRR